MEFLNSNNPDEIMPKGWENQMKEGDIIDKIKSGD